MLRNLRKIFQYLGFKFSSGFLYSIAIVLFYSSNEIESSLIILVVQEFYFSFFLTFYRVRHVGTDAPMSIALVFFLSLSVLLVTCFYCGDLHHYFLFYIAICLFPFYVYCSSSLEKKNFDQSIRYENISAISSSIIFFILSCIFSFSQMSHISLIYSRFLMLYLMYLILIYIKKRSYLELLIKSLSDCKVWGGNANIVEIVDSLRWVLFIAVLMLFKISYYNIGLLSIENNGNSVKYLLIGYDLIAAVYGYFVRFVVSNISLSSNSKISWLGLCFVSFTAAVFLFLVGVVDCLGHTLSWSILVSFVLAASFSLFIMSKSMLFMGVYSFSLLALAVFGRQEHFLLVTSIYFVTVFSCVGGIVFNARKYT